MWKQYHTVDTLEQALELLAVHGKQARIVAGATDLIIELERHQRPELEILIDISRVPELAAITRQEDMISLGPLVTHNQVVVSPPVVKEAFPLAQAAWEVGAPQIRNRATIAGNLITASPANDTITPLWALGASVTLRSIEAERTLPLAAFYTGLRQTVMQPDEMLTRIDIPAMQPNQRGIFLKLGLRRVQAISVVNIAAVLTLDDGQITDAAVTYGSVAPTILQATAIEDFLRGKPLNEETIVAAAKLAATIPTPIDDVRAPATYRTEMVKVLTARALRRLRDDQHRIGFPENPAMLWGQASANGTAHLARHDQQQRHIRTTVNGHPVEADTGFDKTLLDFLRDDCGYTGTKVGCAEGECGACTVFLDDMAVMSCMVPAPRAHGADIVTVEGLADNERLHPIQAAFVETGAVQCGFCIPGFLMSAAKLLDEHPQPDHAQILQSISGNLCRCTGYYKIVDAVTKASQQLKSEE